MQQEFCLSSVSIVFQGAVRSDGIRRNTSWVLAPEQHRRRDPAEATLQFVAAPPVHQQCTHDQSRPFLTEYLHRLRFNSNARHRVPDCDSQIELAGAASA